MTTVNTHFNKDASGQWWFTFRDGRRTKAREVHCARCGAIFPIYRPQQFCSVQCRVEATTVQRERGWCAHCRKEFALNEKGQRYCSHACAARAYHAKQSVTTDEDGPIKNSGNPRFSRDEQGQWWYTPIGSRRYARTRASIGQCLVCEAAFLRNMFYRSEYCSRSCAHRAFYKKHRGEFVGPKSRSWKGGTQRRKGYVFILAPDHPRCRGNQRRYIAEHMLVMEKQIGRYLEPHERVHHKNGVRDDNRPENLELWAHHHPSGQRVTEQQHCPTCTCFQVAS